MDDLAPGLSGETDVGQPFTEAPSPRAKALREEMLGSALTLDEVAYILSLDRTTVAKYLRERTIVGFQIGREWRVTEEELRAYVRAQSAGRRYQLAVLEPPIAETNSRRGVLADMLLHRSGRPKTLQTPQAAMSEKFDRFTAHARRVLELAQDEAMRLNHNYIGTEHLLLGLIRETEGVAAQVLSQLGVEIGRLRSGVEYLVGRGDPAGTGETGLTPRARKAIELAVDEARLLGHHYVGTEHLLLGLAREGHGIAAGVLKSLDLHLEKIRKETLNVLQQANPDKPVEALPNPRPIPDQATSLVAADQEALTCFMCGARSPMYFRYCFNCGSAVAATAEPRESNNN